MALSHAVHSLAEFCGTGLPARAVDIHVEEAKRALNMGIVNATSDVMDALEEAGYDPADIDPITYAILDGIDGIVNQLFR